MTEEVKEKRKRPHWADRQLDAFYESEDGKLPDSIRRVFDKIYKFFDDHWHMIEGIYDDPAANMARLEYVFSNYWKTILNQRIALRKLQKAYEKSLRRLKNVKAEIKSYQNILMCLKTKYNLPEEFSAKDIEFAMRCYEEEVGNG